MKIYKTKEQVNADIKDGTLTVVGDVEFKCSISINAFIKVYGDIIARNINAIGLDARNVNARNVNIGADIKAYNITAYNINASDINAYNITAFNIIAWDINAWDINALDIVANNIQAWSINAKGISYHAFCNVYEGISCASINSRREVHSEPVCLGGELTIKAKLN